MIVSEHPWARLELAQMLHWPGFTGVYGQNMLKQGYKQLYNNHVTRGTSLCESDSPGNMGRWAPQTPVSPPMPRISNFTVQAASMEKNIGANYKKMAVHFRTPEVLIPARFVGRTWATCFMLSVGVGSTALASGRSSPPSGRHQRCYKVEMLSIRCCPLET